MKFKLKNIVLVSLLAVAGIFSATAVASNKQVNETPVVEKAEAASKPSTVKIIGLKLSGSYWGQAGAYYTAHVWGGSKGTTWPGVNFDNNAQVSGDGKIVYADVSAYTGFTNIIIARWNNSSHSTEWNRWEGSFSANADNFFTNNGWTSCSVSKDYDPGYYLFSNKSSWGIANAIAADSPTVGSNNASWTNVSFSANNEFKIGYYNMGGGIDYQNNGFSGQHNGFSWATSYASNNIKCTASSSGNKIFLDSSWKVAINRDVTVTCYEAKDGTNTSKGSVTGNTDILLSESLGSTFVSYTGYSITGYYTTYSAGSYTNPITPASYYPSANMNVYAKYEVNTYTITYYKVMNGLYMDWWGSSTVSAHHFQKYSDIEPAEIYGYGFEGWYSDSSCTTGIGSNDITGNATVYAKYTSDPSNNTYYVGLPSGACYDNVTYGGSLRVYYSNGEDDVKDAPAHHIAGITSTNLYLVSIPSDVTWFAFHSGLSNYSMQSGHRTVSVGPDTGYDPGSNNLFLCKNETTTAYDGGQTEYVGEWTTCYFQFQTASNSTFSSNLSKVDMSEPSNMSSGNDAEAIGVTGTASYYFRIAVVINGSENFLTTVGTDANTSSCTASSGSNRFKASNLTINVYLKDNVIYLLDTSDIDAGGYLYISCGDSLTDIKITVAIKNSSGTTVYPFSSSKLSTVTSTTNTNTLTFNSVEGLIRIPIYNLRGELTPDKSKQDYYSVTFNSNSAVNIPILTTKTDYYMSSLAATPTTTSAPAASVAYDFDAAVSNASNKSVCNIDTTTAKFICGKYDALSSTEKGTFSSASISTWNSTKPTYSGNQDVPMTAILYQVSRIANDGVSRGSLGLFGHFGLFGDSESSMSTIIIIISSSVALLSVTALSILVIRKRKSKEIE